MNPSIVFTDEGTAAFSDLPEDVQRQVLAAAARFDRVVDVASIPVIGTSLSQVTITGVVEYPAGAGSRSRRFTSALMTPVPLVPGDVLEIRVRKPGQVPPKDVELPPQREK